MLKAICLGRICYDMYLIADKTPAIGTTSEFFEKQSCGGGAAANIGYCLAKWGIHTAISGVLGNDVYGNRIKQEFDKFNIDQRYIEQSYDNDTPLSVVVIDKEKCNHTTYNISDKYIGLKKCDFDFTPDLIVVDGYDVVQARNVIERFPKVVSILDATIVTSSVLDLLRKVDYAVCTREFAESATGVKIDFDDPTTLTSIYKKLKNKYVKTEFVITLGVKGALYCINNQIKITPSLKVEAIDTTGCGNVFRGAFAHTIANGGDIEKATKMGCIAGSLAATKYGARLAIPTYEEVSNIYEQKY